jgi:ABC-type Mn2+/Zn2+ transport system ATPase subunit
VLDPASPEELRSRAADVRFENVTFARAGAEPLFQELDLAVPSGARIGLVGRSGGGKTTLSRLLLRMTDIDAGRILIGGQDISRLRQTDLRSLIAYVPQDPADTDVLCGPEAGEGVGRRERRGRAHRAGGQAQLGVRALRFSCLARSVHLA